MNSRHLKENIGFAVVFGLLAAFINLFRLPLFFEAEFVFGPFLVLLLAVFRGPLVGLIASTIATIPLFIAWGSLWSTLVFGLEALFVGYICTLKRINVILVVMVFWLLIGMPVSWYSISQYEFFLDSHRTSILIKQLTNAILYAHITALLMYLPVVRNYLAVEKTIPTFSIKQQSSHIISSLLITVGILFFFFNLNQNIKSSSEKFSLEHDNKHRQLAFHLTLLLDEKLKAIEEFKYTLSNVWQDAELRQQNLLAFNHRHPEFKTMILVDKKGNVIASSPPEMAHNVVAQNESLNVSDRDYFQHSINDSDLYVSPGFMGRGFGNELITAMSAGVPDMNDSQQNIGVLEGSFILNSVKEIQEIIDASEPSVSGILVDQKNQVLVASESVAIPILHPLNLSKGVDDYYDHNLVSINDADGSIRSEVYYVAESGFDFDWKLITLQNESQFANVIEKTLIAFAVSIVLLVLISRLLAMLISHSWSYSMLRLNRIIEQGDGGNGELADFEDTDRIPLEINNLYIEIKNSRLEILKMNKELQTTVAERTEKLQKANARLNVMARQDALTQLENRRVFTEVLQELWQDCQTNLLSMSLVIIDLDHFKKINDCYGHPVGDDVLVQLAKELEKFKEPSIKCMARIGGEEFCLLIKGVEHQYAFELAEKIRNHIDALNFHIGADKSIEVTVSMGLATIDPTKFTPIKLYQLADNALYEAKHAGRNQVKEVTMF